MSATYTTFDSFLNTERRKEHGRFINSRFKILPLKDEITLYDNRTWKYIFGVSKQDTLHFINFFNTPGSKWRAWNDLKSFNALDLARILKHTLNEGKGSAFKQDVYILPTDVAYQINQELVIDIPSGDVVTGQIAQQKINVKDHTVNLAKRRAYMQSVKNIRKILGLMHIARAFDVEKRIIFSYWEQRRIILQTPLDVFVNAIKEGRVTEDLHNLMTRATGFYLTPEAAFDLYLNQYRAEIRMALGVLE